MASNNFDGAVIIDNGVGSPADPGGYFGFGRAPKADFSNGPRIYAGTGSPNGILVAPMSSLYLQSNGITGTLYIAADSFGAWTTFATNVDVAALLAAVAVLQGQIIAINAQIAALTAAIATNTAAIAAANTNLLNFIAVLAAPGGAAHIGVASFPGGLQAQLDYIMTQLVVSTGNRDWFPLLAQSPLNAKTDYFLTGTIPSKWTRFDPGGNTTFSCPTSTRLTMVQHTGPASGENAGLIQSAPAVAQYCVTCALFVNGATPGGILSMGTLIGGDLIGSPASEPFVVMEYYSDGTPNLFLSLSGWTDYNSVVAPYKVTPPQVGWYCLLTRIFVDNDAGTYTGLAASKGNDWRKLFTVAAAATTLPTPPATVGMVIDNVQSGTDMTVYSPMFRIDETPNMFLPCGGYA